MNKAQPCTQDATKMNRVLMEVRKKNYWKKLSPRISQNQYRLDCG